MYIQLLGSYKEALMESFCRYCILSDMWVETALYTILANYILYHIVVMIKDYFCFKAT